MIWKNRERGVGEESGGAMAFAFGRATPSLRQAPFMCLDNPVLGNIIFSLNGEHHLLLKVLHFRVDKRNGVNLSSLKPFPNVSLTNSVASFSFMLVNSRQVLRQNNLTPFLIHIS